MKFRDREAFLSGYRMALDGLRKYSVDGSFVMVRGKMMSVEEAMKEALEMTDESIQECIEDRDERIY